MTTYQTGSRIVVAARRETTFNSAATSTSTAVQVRVVGGSGLNLKRAQVRSAEKLATGLQQQGRLGYKSVDGSYEVELTAGGAIDSFAEAILRSAWATTTSIGFATLTTVAIGTQTLTAAGGSWITQGVKVGDIFTLSGTTVSGNNGTNRIVTAVGTLTLVTTTGAFTTLAATATGTLTILRKVTSPTGSPTRYSYTIEQNDSDIDDSEYFTGCRLVGFRLQMQPGQMAKVTPSFIGADRVLVTGAAAPYFTQVSLTTSLPLVSDDSTIRYNGASVASFTGADLNFQITAAGVPVIGSLVTPDIFDNDLAVTGQITALRSDFSNPTLFDGETEFAISILLQEPTGSPPKCFAVYVPRVKFSALSAPVGGGDGAKIETLDLMTGPKESDATNDYGVANFFTSEAAVGT